MIEIDDTISLMRRIDVLERTIDRLQGKIDRYQEVVVKMFKLAFREEEEVMTTQMVCDTYHIDRKTLYTAVKSGALVCKQNKPGGKKWYLRADVKAWLADCPHLCK